MITHSKGQEIVPLCTRPDDRFGFGWKFLTLQLC